MFKIGDVVRFDKSKDADVWATFGKRGRKFEVKLCLEVKGKLYMALRNTVTGSVVKWIGANLIKKVD